MKKVIGIAIVGLVLSQHCAAQEVTGTLKKIKDSSTITLGYRESAVPFSYLSSTQQPIGYAMDICARIVEDIKAQLKLSSLTVKNNPVTETSKTLLIGNNTVDLECGASINNLTQQKSLSFSPAIFLSNVKLVANKAARLKSNKDLTNKTVVVVDGSPYERMLKNMAEKEKLNLKFLYAKDDAESIDTVATGRASATILNSLQISQLQKTKGLDVLATDLGTESISLAYRKNDNEFGALINRTFSRLVQSGEMQKIYDWWFVQKLPAGTALGVPMSGTLKTAMQLQALPD